MNRTQIEFYWNLVIDKAEAIPLLLATRFGPWITPLVPAYFVHRAMIKNLETPVVWAWIAAILISFSLFLNIYLILDRFLFLRAIIFPNQGYLYILKREDGIYKVGRTDNVIDRMKQHEKDYGQKFKVIKTWKVNDPYRAEQKALTFSKGWSHIEGNRQELRRMNVVQLILFMAKVQWGGVR